MRMKLKRLLPGKIRRNTVKVVKVVAPIAIDVALDVLPMSTPVKNSDENRQGGYFV